MKFTTGSPNPRFVKPLPVIVKLAGGTARLIKSGVIALTPRVSVTVSAALPTKLKELVPVCCQTWAWTVPAESPDMFGVSDVAGVGYGTVNVVLPLSPVARACAIKVPLRTKFTTGRPKPRFAKPPPVIVKVAGGLARSIVPGVIPLTPRMSVTVSVALPIRLKLGALDVCCQTWAWTVPAESPGMFGVSDVAGVGYGTVNVVLPLSPVARACAIKTPLRTKFTTGRPKPRFAKPLPVIVKLAGGVARSIGFGVMPLTPGTGRVSVTVSVALPIRLKLSALDVCCQTWAWTAPAESPGMFGVSDVAGVGYGTVNVVLPLSPVARACAIKVPLRTKFTTGRPKPRFAKPPPVIVKVAGGLARSIVPGVIPLTPRMSVTLSVALPIRLKLGALDVCCQTWAWTVPAESPGMFGVSDVAGVGYGTVNVVLPLSPVARACAIKTPLRTKFTTGRPKPRFANPLPVIVKLVGGLARSIGFGVLPLTPGAGRVSVTVSVALPIRLKLSALDVCCQTWAWTAPAESPGMFGVSDVAGVGYGTVNVVLPLSPVARACAIKVPLRTKFTTGRPKPRFAKPPPVIVKVAGGLARSIVPGVIPLTPRMSVTLSVALPIRLKLGALDVCCQTWAWTVPAESPGMFGVSDVAGVGYGTVNVVLPLSPVARACAIKTPLRTKFTTGRPKPRFAKPLPVIVKLVGGVARSIGFGVMPLTPGTGRVSVTVSVALPIRLKLVPLDVCCQTWAWTVPAESPGMFGVRDVGDVGYGTVNVVLPLSPVARACAIKTPLRTKFTTGRPKPRFANPLPVIVKLVGGLARSIAFGAMALTPAAIPVTATVTSPPLGVK